MGFSVRHVARAALTSSLVISPLLIWGASGCSSRLPGPVDCQRMAERLMGEEGEALKKSPAKTRLMTIVTHGCLTTPFDHQAVRCVEESRRLPRCMDELAWRIPERRPAITRFMTRALKP